MSPAMPNARASSSCTISESDVETLAQRRVDNRFDPSSLIHCHDRSSFLKKRLVSGIPLSFDLLAAPLETRGPGAGHGLMRRSRARPSPQPAASHAGSERSSSQRLMGRAVSFPEQPAAVSHVLSLSDPAKTQSAGQTRKSPEVLELQCPRAANSMIAGADNSARAESSALGSAPRRPGASFC